MERAQELGLMKTPKDNYNLVTMYYNAGQFGKATDLLYSGLKDGSYRVRYQELAVAGLSTSRSDKTSKPFQY